MHNRLGRLGALFALITLLAGFISPQQFAQAVEPSTAKSPESNSATIEAATPLNNHKAPLYGEVPAKGDVAVIIHFDAAPLALYTGGVAGLKATNPASRNAATLDLTSRESVAYLNHLTQQHTNFLNEIRQFSPKAERLADYRVAFNGMGLNLPVQDLGKVRTIPGVKAVEVNTIQKLDTDSSIDFIGAPTFWNAIQDTHSERPGEGVIVGIIDTGIYNPSTELTSTGTHPSLVDPSNGFDFPTPAGGYKGVCATTNAQTQDGSFGACNDKLIGAWWYNGGNIANAGEMMSPMDEDGHGTHTATTAAGNEDVMSSFGLVSGVAPYAQVIAYKVCWSEDPTDPSDGGCASVDSTAAIEQAVIDGVDVLNFSIGGGASPWTESVEQAFLGASAAGVIVNASAGNSGPAERTVGHNGPWLTTVAASTQSRAFQGSLDVDDVSAPSPLTGASLYPGAVTGTLKLAPPQTGTDSTPSQCLTAYPAGTFDATDIVICRRGTIARVTKYKNAFAGGAGGAILINANAGESLNAEFCEKVCLHMAFEARGGSAAGEDLVTFVAANPGVQGTLNGGTKVQTRGDIMAGFSSRGESRVIDIIKPDVTLVGVDVIAGNTAFIWDVDFEDNLLFKPLSGTSMSSPHSAGTSALMRQMFPDWTPYEVKSAMMTTAYTDTLQADGVTPTNPFNDGSGRVDLTRVFSAGLVLDETPANFTAANPAQDGQPKTLNLASMAQNACVGACSWTRTLSSTMDTSVTWTASAMVGTGITVTVEPASFTIPANGTQQITVTANVTGRPLDVWSFTEFVLTPDNTDTVPAHFPIAAKPSLGSVPELITIETRRDSGGEVVDGFQSVEISDGQYTAYGLVEAAEITEALAQDSSNSSAFDDLDDGVFYTLFEVPANTARMIAEITESSSQDIDLFVGIDTNNDGIPQSSEVLYTSATAAVLEDVDVLDPAPGTYFAVVQNWGASTSAPDLTTLSLGVVPESNLANFDVDGPSTVAAGTAFEVTVLWDEPAMEAGDLWYGAFDLGTTAGDPDNLGRVAVDVIRLPDNEIGKTVSSDFALSGEVVTYTLTITNYGSITDTFYLTDTLPNGLVIDESSISGGATYDSLNHTINWSGEMGASVNGYSFTDSRFGGPSIPFVDIVGQANAFDVCNHNGGTPSCDEYRFGLTLPAGTGVKFYDTVETTFAGMSNGFVQPVVEAIDTQASYYVAQDLPDAAVPSGLFAGLWTDLDLDGTSATDTGGGSMHMGLFTGVNPAEPAVPYVVTQYQNAQQYQSPSSDLTFEILARADGVESEFCAVYGTLTGNLTTFVDGVTVGIENADASEGLTYYHNGQPSNVIPAAGTTICAVYGGSGFTTHTITYEASATVTETTTFTNNVVISSDNIPGEVNASADVTYATQLPSIELVKTVGTDANACATTDSITVTAGTEVVYCYEVTNTGTLTMTTHNLVDDQLGMLLTDFAYDLGPGQSVFITETATLSATTTNLATWTATSADNLPATAQDSATVTVEAVPTEWTVFLPIVRK